MSAGNAKIGHPAPQFKVTAVVDGQFKDVQLSDYRGTRKSITETVWLRERMRIVTVLNAGAILARSQVLGLSFSVVQSPPGNCCHAPLPRTSFEKVQIMWKSETWCLNVFYLVRNGFEMWALAWKQANTDKPSVCTFVFIYLLWLIICNYNLLYHGAVLIGQKVRCCGDVWMRN